MSLSILVDNQVVLSENFGHINLRQISLVLFNNFIELKWMLHIPNLTLWNADPNIPFTLSLTPLMFSIVARSLTTFYTF